MMIDRISMKVMDGKSTYYRMVVKATELPEWMYLKAKEMDADYGVLDSRDTQYFEIAGYIWNFDKKAAQLELFYCWDDYKTITEFDKNYHDYIYQAFEDFANQYGDRFQDDEELCLEDVEYE